MTTLALMGDVMLGRGVNDALATMRPKEPWGELLPSLLRADLRILNLECALTARREPWMRTPKVFHFRADPDRAVRTLLAAKIDACSLANNHSLDFEVEGLLDTLRALDGAGILHAGAGVDREEARRPSLLPHGVALLACTDNEPDFAANSHPGTHYLPVSLDESALDGVEAWIAEARAAGARTVILSNHWGPNMVERPPRLFRRFAHAAIDRGVDLYYGHSAHLTQGVEVYKDRLILYDTGDFIDDYAVDPYLRNDRSCLFLISLEGGIPRRLEIVPVSLGYARVELARGSEREAILDRMSELSLELGTKWERADGRLVWRSGLSSSPR